MIFLLVFLSGLAALVYQVLWLRDLGLLFGNTAQAAAVDIAVFFGGLAAGAAVFGRVMPRLANPLRVYGYVELGIAASALLYLGLTDAYRVVYVALAEPIGAVPAGAIVLKMAMAILLLGPATFLMGGTLPLIVQHVVRQGEALGRQGPLFYGVNTLGSTLGAFGAGFVLPPLLGFDRSYVFAILVNTGIGVAALMLSRGTAPLSRAIGTRPGRHAAPVASRRLPVRVGILALVSGALTLALEISWIRMCAQVLDHSTYVFSAILVVFLLALACGSLVARRLAGLAADPARVLALLLIASTVAVAIQPPLFVAFTDQLSPVTSDGDWSAYVARVFQLVAAVIFPPGIIVGTIFPYLLRVQGRADVPGAVLARLSYLNLAGGIAGSLAASFVALPLLGLWRTMQLVAAGYGLSVLGTAVTGPTRLAAMAAAVLAVVLVDAGRLPVLHLDEERGERVLDAREGAHGIVAVTETRDGRMLRLNNSYHLGGTVARIERERIQTFLPLTLHPRPESVFFLGLGTGITAGEAVRHPVSRIVVCELVPEVVEASRAYFGEWTRGLADDPRADIRAEDGRHWLSTTGETYDVVISDLFVPWHAGTGSLYSREHFATVRARLRPGGIFAQWLPLFQLSERDFAVIARTLLEVFPHVTVWRGDFYANRPIVGLIASATPVVLDGDSLRTRVRQVVPDSDGFAVPRLLPFYAGNLGEAPDVLGSGAVNTDDRAVIEYLAPAAQWGGGAPGRTSWFVAMPLVRFVERLQGMVPPDRDPYLSALSPGERRYVAAGAAYYRAIVLGLADEETAARRALAEALEPFPEAVAIRGPFMALDPLLR